MMNIIDVDVVPRFYLSFLCFLKFDFSRSDWSIGGTEQYDRLVRPGITLGNQSPEGVCRLTAARGKSQTIDRRKYPKIDASFVFFLLNCCVDNQHLN